MCLSGFSTRDAKKPRKSCCMSTSAVLGVCGVYTYEVAETKVTQVMDFARQHQHPLQCTMEKE